MPADECARWSSWAGSPELIAHIAQTAESALREGRAVPISGPSAQGPVDFHATVVVGRDAEVFARPKALAEEITPEALRGCQSIALVTEAAGIRARIVFTLGGDQRTGVLLRVHGNDDASADEVAVVAATIAMAVQRGFRRLLGRVEFSSGLRAGNVGVRSRFASPIETGLPFALGGATGLMAAWFLTTFFPDANLPAPAQGAIAILPALAYSLWFARAVPDVEIASDGKTRLLRGLKWAVAGLATLLLTTLVKSLLGTS
jgi:hypothetical protein